VVIASAGLLWATALPIAREVITDRLTFGIVKKEARIKFCKWVLSLDYNSLTKRPAFISRFTDFELRNLESLDRFRQICSGLSEQHYPDAFHLWTAEVNKLAFFLTTDQKFIRAITETSRITFTTRPIPPSEFLEAAQKHDIS
jgi:hypothetical protein